MAHFPKPAEGSWTAHYPELGTAPVSYEDSISPEHYELEREAIFRRTWLNVGRVEQGRQAGKDFTQEIAAARALAPRTSPNGGPGEQVPKAGNYFTKEIDAARTSVIVVRGTDGEVRAFHN